MLADGIELPEHLANAPTLSIGLGLYYNAFQDLSTCRSIGMSLGPIPWTAMNDYCHTYEIGGIQREQLFMYVESMDNTYREFVEKKNEKKGKR